MKGFLMKVIRISDAVHEHLKQEAKREGRTLQWVVEQRLTEDRGTSADPINFGAPDFGEAAIAEATPHSQVEEKLSAPKDDVFVPRPPDPETGYPCCQQNKPCKHWQWDTYTGEGYVNTLTGKMKAVL